MFAVVGPTYRREWNRRTPRWAETEGGSGGRASYALLFFLSSTFLSMNACVRP